MEQLSKSEMTKKCFDFSSLNQRGRTIVEYVWIGGFGSDIRSKAKVYDKEINSVEDLEIWNYDGSSTGQATTSSSEINLIPVALFDDPFRGIPNKFVLCETYNADGTPTPTNFRHYARQIFDQDKENVHDPWFGVEQEYNLTQRVGTALEWPYGWPLGQFPKPQFFYYCSNGSKWNYGREIADTHLKACLNAGVKLFGINAEVMAGQWEYQVGTCRGLELGDHMWAARYLCLRVGELFGVDINLNCKPIVGDWNGAGAHTNYSTNGTRNDKDMTHIKEHMVKLEATHTKVMQLYGEGNEERLTGKHETSSYTKFNYHVAHRGASVRIPRTTEKTGNGYYEDRRPGSNMDPYVVTSALFSITCLDNFMLEDLIKAYAVYKENKAKLD